MTKLTITILTCVTLLMFVTPVQADGIIIIDPPLEPPPDWEPWLTIRYHRVSVNIEDQIATTEVDQVFRNDGPGIAEGRYVFPLPPGAMVQDFVMWIDGEAVQGEILPAQEARQIYESYVNRQRDPALLEYVGRDTVRARIFPIPPGEERRIQLTYTQILATENGLSHYRYPLDTEQFSATPLEHVSIYVNIKSNAALRAIYSPSHQDNVVITRPDDYQATISYEASHILPKQDFELYTSIGNETIGANVLTYKTNHDDGFFLLMLTPSIEAPSEQVLSRDVFLVLDTSGSMDGEKLEQAQQALIHILEHLNIEDRFNIITFSSDVRAYATAPQASKDVARAIRWVRQLEALGGTNIYLALSETLAQVDPGRASIIIFLTDGLPTEGIVDENDILSMLKQQSANAPRIFPFGVGYDVNTLFLDQLAQEHKGRSAYVEPHERIDEKISAFYAQVQSPVLSNIALDFGNVQTYDLYPQSLNDLYAGTQLIVTGRYTGDGPQRITLTGDINGTPKDYTYEGNFSQHNAPDAPTAFIPRLWAARKIGHLLTQIRLHGENTEWIEAIVTLSLRYGIITPYTSFLVEEPETALSTDGRQSANEQFEKSLDLAPSATGEEAVQDAEMREGLGGAAAPPAAPQWTSPGTDEDSTKQHYLRYVGDKTFLCTNQVCTDTDYIPDQMQPQDIVFMSARYWELLDAHPEWASYFALNTQTLFVANDKTAYRFRFGTEAEQISQPTNPPDKTATPTATQAPQNTPPTPPPNPTTSATPVTKTQPALCNGAIFWIVAGALVVFQQHRSKYH